MNTPSTSVSPGLGGFIAFFVLALALWLLMRNMNGRMRRMSYRAEQRDAERRAGAGGATAAGEGDATVVDESGDEAGDSSGTDEERRGEGGTTPDEGNDGPGQDPSGR